MKNYSIDVREWDNRFPGGFYIRSEKFSSHIFLTGASEEFFCSITNGSKEYDLEGETTLFLSVLQQKFGSQVIDDLWEEIFDEKNLDKTFGSKMPTREEINSISDPEKELKKYLVEE